MFGAASVSGTCNSKISRFADLLNQSYFFKEIIDISFRKMPNDSAIWMFSSWRSLPVMMKAAVDCGRGIESCLVWDKKWIGPGGSVGLRPSYELCLLITSGTFALPNRGLPDIWAVQWSSHKPNGHPSEKPVKLMYRLIKETPGDIILDPFMGSGTTLVAAKQLGRRAIGIEIEEKYCKIAVERLAQENLFETI
jgi:site-specific DNA-methyltransferase (adenine-specific)